MGGISLPALHLNPPQPQQNMLESAGQLMQLKNMMANAPLQRQALQQSVQAGALENQKAQDQMNDQKAATLAMQQWDGKSMDDLASIMLKHGASSSAVMGVKKQALDQREKYSQIAKTDAETGASTVATLMKKNDLISGAFSTVLQAPDDQLPQAILSTSQQLAQQNLLDPQHLQMAQQLAQTAQTDPNKGRQALDMMRKGMMADSQLLEEAQKKAQTGEATARANEATVNAQLAPAKLANQQANDTAMRKQGQQRLSIEAAKLNFERQRAGIDSMGSASTLAQAIAQGHITPDRMGYLLSRNPGLMEGVLKEDPSFDSSKAQAYPTVYKDFTSGKASIALNAGGTALGHLKELSDMNTNASHIPGTPDYNAYQNKADTVASELAKFYGDATIPAIAAIKKTLTATLPGNRQAAIKTQAQSMGDKLDSFQQQWDNAAPSKAYQAPMPGISGSAKAARQTLAGGGESQGNASTFSVAAPNGRTYTFKDQASADAFKQKAGIK